MGIYAKKIFNYVNNKTGGELGNGIIFISDCNEKEQSASVALLKQVSEDEFEEVDVKRLSVGGEPVNYNLKSSMLDIKLRFDLSK